MVDHGTDATNATSTAGSAGQSAIYSTISIRSRPAPCCKVSRSAVCAGAIAASLQASWSRVTVRPSAEDTGAGRSWSEAGHPPASIHTTPSPRFSRITARSPIGQPTGTANIELESSGGAGGWQTSERPTAAPWARAFYLPASLSGTENHGSAKLPRSFRDRTLCGPLPVTYNVERSCICGSLRGMSRSQHEWNAYGTSTAQ